jgi:hypothetical protein
MIGGGTRRIAGITGRYLLAELPPVGHTSGWWTQAERDAYVAGGILPAQPSLFEVSR